ncbi:hypothetical protein [Aquincola sp. J276]|nr:hypothetical protein [Aquincola sp. J276]MCR5867060.1 hypothetical protein [Aquincola sp. J276]
MNRRLLRTLAITAAMLLLAYALHPFIPPEWAQPVRHFLRELWRILT